MTLFSIAPHHARGSRGRSHGHIVPITVAGALALIALAVVAYLLWPTWTPEDPGAPASLPVSIGGTLFNVPTAAVRMKIQRHSGSQERVDLSFNFPSLEPPGTAKHLSGDAAGEPLAPIDRIFLSITAHHDAMAPDTRVRTIYPRYLEEQSRSGPDGLTIQAFREGTPYSREDLFFASEPKLTARCSREAATPGMCLSERRLAGADLTFRFPRSWLSRWREVAGAMDRLATQLHGH